MTCCVVDVGGQGPLRKWFIKSGSKKQDREQKQEQKQAQEQQQRLLSTCDCDRASSCDCDRDRDHDRDCPTEGVTEKNIFLFLRRTPS